MCLFSFGIGDLKHCLLKQMNIQIHLIIVIVKHVLRSYHYRSTVLVFTSEITATLKVTRVILATNKMVSAVTKLSKPLQSDIGH